jgi:hypothetical protein
MKKEIDSTNEILKSHLEGIVNLPLLQPFASSEFLDIGQRSKNFGTIVAGLLFLSCLSFY